MNMPLWPNCALNNSVHCEQDLQTQGTRPMTVVFTSPQSCLGAEHDVLLQRRQTKTSRTTGSWLSKRTFTLTSLMGGDCPITAGEQRPKSHLFNVLYSRFIPELDCWPPQSLWVPEYKVTPANRDACVYLRAKLVNAVFWLRPTGLMASFHRLGYTLYHWPWHFWSSGLTCPLPKSWRALRSHVFLHILQSGSSIRFYTIGKCQEVVRPPTWILICGGSGCYLPSWTSTAQMSFIGGAWEVVTELSMQTGGLGSWPETRDEGMSLSGLYCSGRIVPSQFFEASV